MYEFPKINFRYKNSFKKLFKKDNNLRLIFSVIIISSVFGFLSGSALSIYFYFQLKDYLNLPSGFLVKRDNDISIREDTYEQARIKAVREVSLAVVSIVVSKDVPIFEKYYYNPFEEFKEFFGDTPFQYRIPQYVQKGTEKKEVGGGTGFIVSSDGIILTNKHVVLDEEAQYTVFTNDGRKFTARVLDRDPFQDLAVLKIEQEKTLNGNGQFSLKPFPVARLGDSDALEMGQTVITVGNALGEFRNTVSVGVISGLGRRITASGGGLVETLEDVIQTDAAINKGNSGGPLVNLKGEVIGINTAMASDAQSIGFAIPINKAKRDIEQVKELGKIVYPFLGIRYLLIDEQVKQERNLAVDYGVLIVKGPQGEPAVWEDSAAQKAGLKEGDIVLEFNNEKITAQNPLSKIIMEYNPGDKIVLRFLRDSKETAVEVVLGEREE